MRYILHILALAAIILAGCTSSNSTKEDTQTSSLLGEWELSKEIINGKTLDYKAEEIKTLISFKGEGYFIYFDDLSESGLGSKIAKIQTHYKGQYEVEGDNLILSYTNDSRDFDDKYTIKSNTDKELVLLNQKSLKEAHYIKR